MKGERGKGRGGGGEGANSELPEGKCLAPHPHLQHCSSHRRLVAQGYDPRD